MSDSQNPSPAQKGGKTRAERLSPQERQAIAQKAALARWGRDQAGEKLPVATHKGDLVIGTFTIQCAVLEGGNRVISERGLLGALGIVFGGRLAESAKSEDGVVAVPLYLGYRNLRPFIPDDLLRTLATPTRYVSEAVNQSGSRLPYQANGVPAELLPKICEVWLKAREAGVLRSAQLRVALNAEILVRGLAHVGILALVDEATGYQSDRARNALAKILEEFIAKELQPYIKTFPIDYYKELCRLKGVPFDGTLQHPRYFGTLTNNIVYSRLAPGVLEELKRRNPSINGRRKAKQFQLLTENIGYTKLMQHLSSVVTLMKISPDYDQFVKFLDTALPKQVIYPLFDGWPEESMD